MQRSNAMFSRLEKQVEKEDLSNARELELVETSRFTGLFFSRRKCHVEQYIASFQTVY